MALSERAKAAQSLSTAEYEQSDRGSWKINSGRSYRCCFFVVAVQASADCGSNAVRDTFHQ